MKSIGWVTTQSPESGKMSLLAVIDSFYFIIGIISECVNIFKYLGACTKPGHAEEKGYPISNGSDIWN